MEISSPSNPFKEKVKPTQQLIQKDKASKEPETLQEKVYSQV